MTILMASVFLNYRHSSMVSKSRGATRSKQIIPGPSGMYRMVCESESGFLDFGLWNRSRSMNHFLSQSGGCLASSSR